MNWFVWTYGAPKSSKIPGFKTIQNDSKLSFPDFRTSFSQKSVLELRTRWNSREFPVSPGSQGMAYHPSHGKQAPAPNETWADRARAAPVRAVVGGGLQGRQFGLGDTAAWSIYII